MSAFKSSDPLDERLAELFRREPPADTARLEALRLRLLAEIPEQGRTLRPSLVRWAWVGSLSGAVLALGLVLMLWTAPPDADPGTDPALPAHLQPLAAYVDDEENLARLESLLAAFTERDATTQVATDTSYYSLDTLSVDQAWSLGMGTFDNDLFL